MAVIEQQKDILSETYIEEKNIWEENIYEIQEEDYVHGGKNGYDNIPHEQLANRSMFLKETCDNLITTLTNFKTQVDMQDKQNTITFTDIKTLINNLDTELNALEKKYTDRVQVVNNEIINIKNNVINLDHKLTVHTHNYAGSDTPGGDANTIKTQQVADKINIVGVGNNKNELLYSNVFVENDKVIAKEFEGSLNGTAKTSSHLASAVDILFGGDVIGSYKFDGSQNMNVNLTISKHNLTPGTFGAIERKKLNMNEKFIIPQFTVNNKGLITEAKDIELTLPDEAISGTTNSLNTDSKIYLVGAKNQDEKQETFSNINVYTEKSKLFSNNDEVVTLNSNQKLMNKTYNGYELNEACEYKVDKSTNGVVGSNDLVTSNALAKHTHKYAGSNSVGGKATLVEITQNDTDKNYILVGNKDGKVEYNSQVELQNNQLKCDVIYANSAMHIPGGKLWIDTSAKAVDGSSFNTDTLNQISKMQADIDELKSHSLTSREINTNLNVKEGNLLAYKKGGYVFADYNNADTCENIVIATSDVDVLNNTVNIMDNGMFALGTEDFDGESVYVGINGQMIIGEPTITNNYYQKK